MGTAVIPLVVGLVALVGAAGVAAVIADSRRRHHRNELLGILTLFGPGVARVQVEPRELVPWSQVATSARTLFPQAFQELDQATGARFPFSADLIDSVHARWTTQWLAWERDHDLEYKRRVTELEVELEGASPTRSTVLRARLAEVEQEKLLRYQERYEEYVQVGKAMGELKSN